MPARDIEFGWVATAAGAPGTPDRKLFEDLEEDAALFHTLGFGTAWMLEHHFSDYFPTPDPMQMLTYLGARFPDLNLGTCVIVTPWHGAGSRRRTAASNCAVARRSDHAACH